MAGGGGDKRVDSRGGGQVECAFVHGLKLYSGSTYIPVQHMLARMRSLSFRSSSSGEQTAADGNPFESGGAPQAGAGISG